MLLPFIGMGQIEHIFNNPAEPLERRVDDFVSKLTLEEKVDQLMFEAPGIPRLGVRNYSWWNECLHGIGRNGKATVFPQAIGLGATFDTDLMYRIGEAIALEGRAKYNANKKTGYMQQYAGLTYWSPNVNLFRDPRWGRGQETYGEDPYLIGEIGAAFVRGLQGDGKQLKVAAMAKHYAVHSGPEKLRHEFDAQVSDFDLWNTYLPAFEKLIVDADVEGVMGAYNRTNGKPCCAHNYLMGDVLYDKWDFDGYFVSDCWALVDLYAGHKVVENVESAAALALKSGCNLNCGSTYPSLIKSYEQGLVTDADIDKNLKDLMRTRFRLGLFDPEGSVAYDKIGLDVVRSKEHIALSHEAAVKSLVLLKNEENLLPLSPDIQTLFVTGPTATDVQALLANYYGVSSDLRTILEGITDNVSDHTALRFVQGALLDRENVNPMDWFSDEAKLADVTIACVGITQLMEGEEGESIASPSFGDREYINLPAHQIEFLKLIRSKAKKLVVVITGGSAISSPEVHEMADAILYAWYPGEQGGQAVGDVIFGKESPSGKLPVTFVKNIEDLPPYEDYNMKNRTYRYLETEPLYPFGFGLSYADIRVSDLQLLEMKNGMKEVTVTLKNHSDVSSEEVVQLYLKNTSQTDRFTNGDLKRFKRVQLNGDESKSITFQLDMDDFSVRDAKGDKKKVSGTYALSVGTSAPFQRSIDLGATPYQTVQVVIK